MEGFLAGDPGRVVKEAAGYGPSIIKIVVIIICYINFRELRKGPDLGRGK
jgi:hypothetical protein